MRIIFTGGGTGGHVFPNVAIIAELKRIAGKKADLRYIGQKGAFEENIAEENKIPFYGIHAGKFRRYWSIKNFIDALKVPFGIFEARRYLKKFKPDLVFAKGGYVSVPVIIAAGRLKIPIWLHESDFSPGLATKLGGKFASKIFFSFEESKKFFPDKETEAVGNPIRLEMISGRKERGFKLTGFTAGKPIVLVMGGSSGATGLNNMLFEILAELTKHSQVIHITGRMPVKPFLAAGLSPDTYRCFEFLGPELADCYAISDLVISRAGSGAIFETLLNQKPMILVPLPLQASRGDQIENAKVFEDRGWAYVCDQNSTKPAEFLKGILVLLKDDKLRRKMAENQKKAVLKNAAGRIAEEIFDFTKQHDKKT